MNIIPAIDLLGGNCVRLYQGDYQQCTVYNNNPVAQAQYFEQQGASQLHLVDLEGARVGLPQHYDTIADICSNTAMAIQVGGGIRMSYQLQRLFDIGVDRVVIGSIAYQQPNIVREWLQQFGAQKIVVAMDIQLIGDQPMVVINGWQQQGAISLWKMVQLFPSLQNVLCTDVARDGALTGPNNSLYTEALQQYPEIEWIASGGVASIEDLLELKQIGVTSAVMGKALYEQQFTLEEALAC